MFLDWKKRIGLNFEMDVMAKKPVVILGLLQIFDAYLSIYVQWSEMAENNGFVSSKQIEII